MKYRAIILLLAAVCISCNHRRMNGIAADTPNLLAGELYLIDVSGDSAPDSILVERDTNEPYISHISLQCRGIKERIISIVPSAKGEFVMTDPPIESLRLEANAVQSAERGIRIISRNTDYVPDYVFIDLRYKNDRWHLQGCYIVNSVVEEGLQMKYVAMDEPLDADSYFHIQDVRSTYMSGLSGYPVIAAEENQNH